MKKFLFVLCCFALSSIVAEVPLFPVKSGGFEAELSPDGATLRTLRWKGKSMTVPGEGSFYDRLCIASKGGGKAPVESFGDLRFELVSWERNKTGVTVTFSARGVRAFRDLRLYKSFIFPASGNEIEVRYRFVNCGKSPLCAAVNTRTFLRRECTPGKVNLFHQPRKESVELLSTPGNARGEEWSLEPKYAWSAFAGKEDDCGGILFVPKDRLAALYGWFSSSKPINTLEYWLTGVDIAPGKSSGYTVTLRCTEKVGQAVAALHGGAYQVRALAGIYPGAVRLLASGAGKKKAFASGSAAPGGAESFEVTLKRQFQPCVYAVRLPKNVFPEGISVWRSENGAPTRDRQLPHRVKRLDNGEYRLLIAVPPLKGDIDQMPDIRGGYAFFRGVPAGETTLRVRVEMDRKAAPPSPAFPAGFTGPELIFNGSFETPSAKGDRPAGRVVGRNFKVPGTHFWEKGIGRDGSRGIRVSRLRPKEQITFSTLSLVDPGVRYRFSAWVKCDNKINGGVNIFLWFFDADRKKMAKGRIPLLSRKGAFGWTKLEKEFYPPKGAVFLHAGFNVHGVGDGQKLYVDDVSLVPEDFSAQARRRSEVLRDQLVKSWYKPLDVIEKISHETVTPHKKWLKPGAYPPPELLFMCSINSTEDTTRRKIVELAQRMDLKYTFIPLLQQIDTNNSHGVFGSNGANWGKQIEPYVTARMQELSTPPKCVLIYRFDFKNASPEFVEILKKWQKAGSGIVFWECAKVPAALTGKLVPAPAGWMLLPQLREVPEKTLNASFAVGPRAALVSSRSTDLPCVPESFVGETMPSYYSKDYPWWEYSYLPVMKAVLKMSGTPRAAEIMKAEVRGNKLLLTIRAAAETKAVVEIAFTGMHREMDMLFQSSVELRKGEHTVDVPLPGNLPCGVLTGEIRLLTKEGKSPVHDCAAISWKTPETPIDVELAAPDRIFRRGGEVSWRVKGSFPKDYTVVCHVTDAHGRLIADSRTGLEKAVAKGDLTFRFTPKAPFTVLNRLCVELRAPDGRIAGRKSVEFSLPEPGLDPADARGFIWIGKGEMNYLLRELGFSMMSVSYGRDTRGMLRNIRNLDMTPVTIGSGGTRKYFIDYKNDRLTPNDVRTPCFSDPAYAEKLLATAEQAVQKFEYPYYDVKYHLLSDEAYIGGSVCYSPHCLARFREALKKYYPSLDALNREWGTDFRKWDDVRPRQLRECAGKSFAPWLLHRLFMSGVFASSWCGTHIGVLEKTIPGSHAGLSGTGNAGLSYDWNRMLKRQTFLCYYGGSQRYLVHSFKQPGMITGQWGGGYTPAHELHEQYNCTPLWDNLFMGANLLANWHGTAMLGDVTPSASLRVYAKNMREITRGPGKLVLGAEPPETPVAVLYSQSSLYTAMATVGASAWHNAVNGWIALLNDLQIPFRFISYEQLADGKFSLKGFKVLVLPVALSLSEAESRRIAAFCRAGGTVLADMAPGRYSASGIRKKNPILAELFPDSGTKVELTPRKFDTPELKGEFITAEKALPACVERPVGKGRAVNFNLSFGGYQAELLGGAGGELSTVISGSAELCRTLRALVAKRMKAAGAVPAVRLTDAKGNQVGARVMLRKDGPNYVLGIIRREYSGRRFDLKKGADMTVTLPFAGHIYDVREGKYLGSGKNFKAKLVPGWPLLYTVMKNKTEKIAVEAPAEVMSGDTLTVSFAAVGASGVQTFHVELSGPDGKFVRPYAANVRGNSVSWQMALEDKPGTWTIRVTHVNTGMKAEKSFKLSPKRLTLR
ncbi:MAG: beta-galactosidase [Lentisphaeria bacterium]|nr:beta-galactosidase [Lentisphaeria bacterium]